MFHPSDIDQIEEERIREANAEREAELADIRYEIEGTAQEIGLNLNDEEIDAALDHVASGMTIEGAIERAIYDASVVSLEDFADDTGKAFYEPPAGVYEGEIAEERSDDAADQGRDDPEAETGVARQGSDSRTEVRSDAADAQPDGAGAARGEEEAGVAPRPDVEAGSLGITADEAQTGETPEQQRQRAEIEARQQQSRTRRGGQRGVGDIAGGPFSNERDQGDLLDQERSGDRFREAAQQPEGTVPIFDDEDVTRQIGWLDPRTGEVTPLDQDLYSVADGRNLLAEEPAENLAQNVAAARADLAARLEHLGLSDKVRLDVVDKLFGDERIAGRYHRAVITVAVGSIQDPATTINHEVIHALRDLRLLKPAEWRALEKAARGDAALMRSVRRRYAGLDLTEAELAEEAVADMFARWARGDQPAKGFIRSAFERIAEFLRVLGEVLRLNFPTAESVMQAIESGEIGSREPMTPQQRERFMVAWHGTPHEFDEFSLDKIGTGEGAQAYGWGLYFAGRKEIAEHYREALSDLRVNVTVRGETFDAMTHPQAAVRWAGKALGTRTLDEAIKETREVTSDLTDFRLRKEYEDILATLERWKRDGATFQVEGKGRLFQVDIPEEGEYLLWDKPLNEQPLKVKAALARVGITVDSAELERRIDEWRNARPEAKADAAERVDLINPVGEDIYRELSRKLVDTSNDLDEGNGWVVASPAVRSDDKAASLALLRAGIAGIKYLDGSSRRTGDGTYNYVVFDDSRIQVLGKFSLANGTTLRGPVPGTTPNTAGPIRTILAGLGGGGRGQAFSEALDRWRTAVQDKMLPLLRTQQKIERRLGRQLDEAENPYLTEELMTGRIGARLERLTDELVNPLFETMRAEGVSQDELETFVYARHAPERNARIAKINPAFAKGGGSGMTDAEAAAIMREVDRSGKRKALERLAGMVDAINAFALDTRVEAGLLSKDEADLWRSTYGYYVPLRGKGEMDGEANERIRRSSGIDVKGKESKRAFGRKSRAADILAYSILQAEEAVVRAETNRVGQAFLALARSAPEPDFWTIDKIRRVPVFNKATGLVSYRSESRISAEDAPYTVSVKVDGEEHRITLNRDNAAAVRLADSMRNLSAQQLGWVVKYLGSVNRFLSMVNTSFNPEFVITNAFRDLQTAGVNLAGVDRDGLIAGTMRDYGKALVASTRGAFKADKGAWGKWYREFVMEGGRVYFNRADDLDALRKRVTSAMQESGNRLGARRAVSRLMEFIEATNSGVENAVRLAAYKNARELGMSKKQAASLAKNLTVNFNRHGTFGPGINAAYLFFNASIQGSARILTAMKSPRVRKILYGVVATGAAMEALNQALSGDDDDGEKFYDKISDFDKSRNFIIMTPWADTDKKRGTYVKLPMPYGYNAFHAMGRNAMEIVNGRSPMEAASELVGTIVDAFNPVGGTQSLLNFIAPTVADPFVDLTRNRDYADRPIMPEQRQFGPETPENQRYWGSVSPIWKAVTDFLNEASGGDDVRPGAIDVSPEVLEYLFGTVTGAAGAFLDRNAGLVAKIIDPESDAEINDWPFVRKTVGQKPGWYDKAAFYSRIDEIEQQVAYAKQYAERGDTKGLGDILDDKAVILALEPLAKDAKKEMARLRKDRAALQMAIELDQVDPQWARETMALIKSGEETIITEFNKAYIKATKIED